MPRGQRETAGELSLRHLPNTSDASFSIQIPNTSSHGDFLLGDDDVSFLRDMAGASTATPGPSKTPSGPFAFDEIIPQPLRTRTTRMSYDLTKPNSPAKARGSPKKHSKPKLKPTPRDDVDKPLCVEKPKYMTQRSDAQMKDNFSILGSLESPNVEVQMIHGAPNDDNFTAPSIELQSDPEPRPLKSRRDRSIAKSKRIVIASENPKIRNKNKSPPTLLRGIESEPDFQQKPLNHKKPHVSSDSEDLTHDERVIGSSTDYTAPDGTLGNPVTHSLKLFHSSGSLTSQSIVSVPKINPESSPAQAFKPIPESVTVNPEADDRDHPIRLSQISPSKPARPLPSSRASSIPPSPMRSSTKRPASIDPGQRITKKGKVTASLVSEKSGMAPASLRNAISAQVPTSNSSSSSQNNRPAVMTRHVRERKASTRQAPRPTTSRLENRSKLGQLDAGVAQRSTSSSTASSKSTLRKDKDVVLPPVNPTKPVEFKFQMDERIEARKAEYEKGRSVASQKKSRKRNHLHHLHLHQQHHPVPDYKSLHALQEAKLAQMKENIVPVVPLSFELYTDGRAREREKFNQHIREKEQELERERERKRKEREEKEEREIKELRRKAIPRAHEVPEWYKDAPKRNKEVV